MRQDFVLAPGLAPTPVWRLRGTGDGPPAYLQAGLHADEIAGMLVLHRLLPRLIADEAAGRLRGDVTVVPQCNPIGIMQFGHGRLLGRFDTGTGHNFNRGFPGAAARSAEATVFAWQAALPGLLGEAEIVLDLHTDDEALPYLYVHAALWPAARDLAACLGAEVVIPWDGGGGGAFEDAVTQTWLAAGAVPGKLCATVELRGQADVTEALAAADAEALHRVLRARGVVAGEADMADWVGQDWAGRVVPMSHVQTIRAPRSGIVSFLHAPGDWVEADEPFCHLVPRPGCPEHEVMLAAPNAGRMFTRMRDRFAREGGVVAKFTGDVASPAWADLPLDD